MRKRNWEGAMKSPRISVRGDIQQKCTHQRLLKSFDKFIKNLHKNLKKFAKIFQKENLIEFKTL